MAISNKSSPFSPKSSSFCINLPISEAVLYPNSAPDFFNSEKKYNNSTLILSNSLLLSSVAISTKFSAIDIPFDFSKPMSNFTLLSK